MRTALFGGTFDPIHSAHLEVARRAADQYRLDRVLFIPAGNPPHKHAEASFEQRYGMVSLVCAADSRFIASRLEEGEGKSYSIDTIARVKAANSAYANSAGPNSAVPSATGPSATDPGAPEANSADTNTAGVGAVTPSSGVGDALFFIIGADAFAEIQSWRRWPEVIRAVEFIVVARPGHEIAGPPGACVHRLESVELPVSSSDIRDALARGESPSELPPAVADYIRRHRLYGSV